MNHPTEFHEPSAEADALATLVVGAAIEVHRQLGPGYPESVYENALCIELAARAIPFERQHPVTVRYRGELVGEGRIDIMAGGILVVELKSVEELARVHFAQVKAYLRATRQELGLLLNFDVALLKDGGIHRVVCTHR